MSFIPVMAVVRDTSEITLIGNWKFNWYWNLL